MLWVVDDTREEAVIGRVAEAIERGRRCRTEAKSDTPPKEALKTVTIGSICIAPPGLRCIHQLGDNCCPEDVVYDDVREAMLPQCTQCEQSPRASSSSTCVDDGEFSRE